MRNMVNYKYIDFLKVILKNIWIFKKRLNQMCQTMRQTGNTSAK